MAKSIYDVLNTVNLYIKITNSLSWEDIADSQKRVKSIIEDKDLYPFIQREIVEASDEKYSNLHQAFTRSKQELNDLIEDFGIRNDQYIFEKVFSEKVFFFEQMIKRQFSRTEQAKIEYKENDALLEFGWYKPEVDEKKLTQCQEEKGCLRTLYDIERKKLNELYMKKDLFIQENATFMTSMHVTLNDYLTDLAKNLFIRKPIERKILGRTIPLTEQLFDKSIIESIYCSVGEDLFHSLDEETFMLVFQKVDIEKKINIKPKMILKVYYLIDALSLKIQDEKSRGAWLRHITSSINWSRNLSTDNILRAISQKRNSADPNFKETISKLLSKIINPE